MSDNSKDLEARNPYRVLSFGEVAALEQYWLSEFKSYTESANRVVAANGSGALNDLEAAKNCWEKLALIRDAKKVVAKP